MKPILLIGGGGHCHSLIDVIENGNIFQIEGIVQPIAFGSDPILGYPVCGEDADLASLLVKTPSAIVAVGQIKNFELRMRLFNRLLELKADIPILISPNAYVSKRSEIEKGTVVMHGAVINAQVDIGENCIINSMALLEHDSSIGAHCHISTGARINGGVTISKGCFIGSGAVIHPGLTIGDGCVIGAGCVVNRDLEPLTTLRSHT